MYRLSIIIPCHNSSKTIGKTLDSILNNNLEKDIYEVIIVDDNSTDNVIDVIKPYKEYMNISYFNTHVAIHCPGNTRQIGLLHAKGEWITFIDHDDYFEPNVFKEVFRCIDTDNIDTVLCTSFYGVYKDLPKRGYTDLMNLPWLHGKFYNHKMLKEYNISFKRNLTGYEDVYFNNMIESYMIMNKRQVWYTKDLFTYNWVELDSSLSHQIDGKLLYMDKHFGDYITAIYDPIFILPDSDYKYKKILMEFLLLYLSYQQSIIRIGNEYVDRNKIHMHNLKNKILDVLNISPEEMIDYYYADPKLYHKLKGDTFDNINYPFIETQSLKDFILTI